MKLNLLKLVILLMSLLLSQDVPADNSNRADKSNPMPGAVDTPDMLADPEAWEKNCPSIMAGRRDWRQFVTPEQLKLFEGPEVDWRQEFPRGQYNTDSLNKTILGSNVPAPGVHPRILFSPEDLPSIRERIAGDPVLKSRFELGDFLFAQTLLNPESDNGKIFARLASDNFTAEEESSDKPLKLKGSQFKGQKAPLHKAHIQYWPTHLEELAFHALIRDDKKLLKRCANAIVNYCRITEPAIDAFEKKEPLQRDYWRSVRDLCGGENLGLCYDLTASVMTPAQRDYMRKYIARVTAGKRAYSQNGPLRWRNSNWTGWDLTLLTTLLAIEGEEGYDQEVYNVCRDTLEAYLTWGFSPAGTIFETNGKNGAGFQWAMVAGIALARRGDNLLGHPHLRKAAEAQVQQVSPAGDANFNNGTYGGLTKFHGGRILAALYPDSPAANWMVRQGSGPAGPDTPLDLPPIEKQLATSKGWNEFSRSNKAYMGGVSPRSYLFYASYKPAKEEAGRVREPWEREYLGLPLDYEDSTHGQLCTRSSNDKDALMMMFESRADLIHGGHQHHNAGHFFLAADGVNWGIESHGNLRDSELHSVVLIDGKGQGSHESSPSRSEWIGVTGNEYGALACANLKNAYDYVVGAASHHSWKNEYANAQTWEVETHPEVVKAFRGTQHYKCRIWANHWTEAPWSPTLRTNYNPVKYAFRTAGVIRGAHPYAIVVDDLVKDNKDHTYTFQMHIPEDVVMVDLPGVTGAVLTQKSALDESGKIQEGAPCLQVMANPGLKPKVVDTEITWRDKPQPVHRLELTQTGRVCDFRVILIPFRFGQSLPKVTHSNAEKQQYIGLEWKDQKDNVTFFPNANLPELTAVKIDRNGKNVLEVNSKL